MLAGPFVSVQEGLDLSTDTGRLVLRLLFSIAEWERDRALRFSITRRPRAIARGVCLGRVPFGYRRGKDGRLEVDPQAGSIVGELFRRRCAGETVLELQTLADRQWSRLGRDWHGVNVGRLLRRRTYRGQLTHGRLTNLARP